MALSFSTTRSLGAALVATALLAACGLQHPGAPARAKAASGQHVQSTGTWYSVQLHAHTTYSDGAYPVSTLIQMAEDAGLDALAVSDHDSTMQWFDPAFVSSTGPLMLHAQEAEDDHGINHLGILGAQGPTPIKPNQPRDGILAQAAARHATIVVNHPCNDQNPWAPLQFDDRASAVEVWNSWWWAPLAAPPQPGQGFKLQNEAGLAWWESLLADGHHVAPVGGSDFHRKPQALCSPVTLVYAEARTESAIYAAIRAGRTGLSHDPKGPRVELRADVDGDGTFESLVGDTIPATAMVQIHVTGGQGRHFRLLRGDFALIDVTVPEADWTSRIRLTGAAGTAPFIFGRLDGALSTMEAMSGALYLAPASR